MESEINHAGLIYTNPDILEKLYRQYIEIGLKQNLPMMIMTPTRKVNFESLKKSKFASKNLIKDSCVFLNEIKERYGTYSQKILIGGLLGCKGDAYSNENALPMDESYQFHKREVLQFSEEKIDFLFAGIMPEVNEAKGMARAMAESNIPYIISFTVRKNGCLIDGTPISEAIRIIDESVDPKPIFYMANCIHPTNLRLALEHEKNRNQSELARFKGIQANASDLSPEELNSCGILHQDDFDQMIAEMQLLYKQFNLKVLGGCCGTNDKFIDSLSKCFIEK